MTGELAPEAPPRRKLAPEAPPCRGLAPRWAEVRNAPAEVIVLMLIAYGTALGVLWRMETWKWISFGFYGVAFEPAVGFLNLILVYLAILPLVYLCPDRHRLGLHLGLGLGFLFLVFSPGMALSLVAAALLCFVVCAGRIGFGLKATLLGLVVLLPAAGLLFPAGGARTLVPFFGFAFAMMAGFKVFLFAFETHTHGVSWRDLPRFLVYLFLAPNVMLPPYHVVIPGWGAFWRSHQPARKADVALKGVIRLGWALLDASLLVLVASHHQAILDLTRDDSLVAWLVALHLRFLELYLGVATAAHVLVALLNGLGFDLKPAMRMPYLSRSFLEFLNRFVPYFKDWMATLFYFPLLMKLRRRMRPLPLQFLAIVNALVIGNTAAHLLRYAFTLDQPAHRARLFEVGYENAFFSAAIALYFVVWKPYEALRDRLLRERLAWLRPAAAVLERAVTVTLFAWLFFFSLGA